MTSGTRSSKATSARWSASWASSPTSVCVRPQWWCCLLLCRYIIIVMFFLGIWNVHWYIHWRKSKSKIFSIVSISYDNFYIFLWHFVGCIPARRHLPRHPSTVWNELRTHQRHFVQPRPNHDQARHERLPRQIARAPCQDTCWRVEPWKVPAEPTHTLRQVSLYRLQASKWDW